VEATQTDGLILDGIAELALQGLASARAYRPLTQGACVRPWADVSATPTDGGLRSQILFGERFDVLAHTPTHAFGRCRRDGAIGWVTQSALSADAPMPTHHVRAGFAEVRAGPARSAAPSSLLPMNALVSVIALEGDFARLSGDGWVEQADLADLQTFAIDPAGVAELRIGSALLEGGRGLDGLDGPGLIQEALYACGQACPRAETDLVRLGEPSIAPERGDLVFWLNGCGVMLDADHLVSADLDAETIGLDTLGRLKDHGSDLIIRKLRII